MTLHMFPRHRHRPSGSPFVIKLETYLRMAGIKYEVDTSKPMGPKGKSPWITFNGEEVIYTWQSARLDRTQVILGSSSGNVKKCLAQSISLSNCGKQWHHGLNLVTGCAFRLLKLLPFSGNIFFIARATRWFTLGHFFNFTTLYMLSGLLNLTDS